MTWRDDGGAKGVRRDQRWAVTGAAGDAMDARRLNGLSQGHLRQDGGQPPHQPRRARPRGPEEQDVMAATRLSYER